jgi:hypothetical protein
MNVEEMVEQAFAYVIDDHLDPAAAAEKAFVGDDRDAVQTLAVVGLRSLVGDELARFRTRSAVVSGASGSQAGAPRSGRYQHATHPSEGAAYFWLTKPYGTADGGTRELLDFNPADWHHNLERETAMYRGAAGRLPMWQLGVRLMESHPRAKKTADLPKKSLAELEAAAESALRGGAVVV